MIDLIFKNNKLYISQANNKSSAKYKSSAVKLRYNPNGFPKANIYN
jgi:hypothetical protein